MSTHTEILLGQSTTLPETPATMPTWRYDCELDQHHVDAMILPPTTASPYASDYYEQVAKNIKDSSDRLGFLATWIQSTIRQVPGGIDAARDVDGGGFTKDEVTPTLFSRWVELKSGTHVRFSESRTAMHNTVMTTRGPSVGGALRSPVMGGVVLEATSAPESLDPRDAVSLAIYEFAKKENANYPWLEPKPGRLFDLTQFSENPYFVGPLYNGHPNEVTDPDHIHKAVDAAVQTIRLTVEQVANS